MTDHIKTERLSLRAPQEVDAVALVEGLNNFEVSKWLATVPYPYRMQDAEEFLRMVNTSWPQIAFIFDHKGLAGCIDTKNGSLGYWIAERAWGQGYATEASRSVVDQFFAGSDADHLRSGYFKGNAGSANVLRKLGFDVTGENTMHNMAQGFDMLHVNMRLTRAAWQASK